MARVRVADFENAPPLGTKHSSTLVTAVTRMTGLRPIQYKRMEVERIYAHELDSEPEVMARKQHQLEKRISSHDELISFLLNNLEKLQSELPNLKAMIVREAATPHEFLKTPRELRLWALFRQRIKTRLEKHLRAVAPKQS